MTTTGRDPHDVIAAGEAVLGIELGSTRIKGVLTDRSGRVLASGGHGWENRLVDGVWTYDESEVWSGLSACFAAVCADAERRHGARPTELAAAGVSAMMHGYVALDAEDRLLVPFRTWRNTGTGRAATELSALLDFAVPLRWSVAHVLQAVLDDEAHLPQVTRLTTLAGWVHLRLTGEHVLGVGDASGMFPIDPATGGWDADRLRRTEDRLAGSALTHPLEELLPRVLVAGTAAGTLTPEGAALLDPSGALRPGAPLCPPEGDAGTGMVATGAVRPRTANVSVGTSVFAMVVLERPLSRPHTDVDVVTTPVGDLVAMVHCNNGASELDAWVAVFAQAAALFGADLDRDAVFARLLPAALEGEPDAGGVLSYNFLSGEPIAGVDDGRPLVLRTPGSRLDLPNLLRAHVLGVFATLAVGMRVLEQEQVAVDVVVGHGGVFRTEGVAQRLLAAALDAPVAVGETAAEGGAWGIAVLAAYLLDGDGDDLAAWLDREVLAGGASSVVEADPVDVAGFASYLRRFEDGLDAARAAAAVRHDDGPAASTGDATGPVVTA